MRVKRFSPDLKVKIPGDSPGVYGMLIAMRGEAMRASHPDLDAFAAHVHGLPFALDAPVQVEVMYFEPHARLHEHSAPHRILFLVTDGSGTVRLGGPGGETRDVTAGDAVLWPAGVDHTAWTDDTRLTAIVVIIFDDHGADGNIEPPAVDRIGSSR